MFLVAPIIAGCAWPWRGFSVRRRIALAGAACIGWGIGYAVYTFWLSTIVSWSVPRGHVGFFIGGLQQIKDNVVMLGHGLVLLCGGGDRPAAWAIPGLVVLVGALALVVRDAASRSLTRFRWICVVVLAQLGLVLVPLLIGSVLDGAEATR